MLTLGLPLFNAASILAALLPLELIGLAVVSAVLFYNTLLRARNRTTEAWSRIEMQLKHRSSLIPNLVETVRGYAAHEHAMFTEVAQAREALAKATGPSAVAAGDQQLNAALGRLMAVAESHPELQTAGTFARLRHQLAYTEEKVAYACQFYNQSALYYNTRLQTFSGNQVARWFRFEPVAFFNAEGAAKEDVRVSFTAV